MTLCDYQNNLEELKNIIDVPKNDYFDFEFSPYNDEFLKIYKFYTEALSTHSYYGIEPAYLYFNTKTTKNAKATKHDGNYIVTINMGTIAWLILNFRDNSRLESEGSIRLFKLLAPVLDTSITNLMFQTALHFTFYHEMAHLVQKSEYLESSLDEIPREIEEFDSKRHILELDADEFGALCIGAHINQYAENVFGESLDQIKFESLVVLFCTPIIFYLLSFESHHDDIYFEEKTHPHPIIRLTYVILTISHYCNQSLEKENKGFSIDVKEITKHAISICDELESNFLETKNTNRYMNLASENREDIKNYIKTYYDLRNGDADLAVYKWNQNAEK